MSDFQKVEITILLGGRQWFGLMSEDNLNKLCKYADEISDASSMEVE